MSTPELVLIIAGCLLVLVFQAAFLGTIVWAVLKVTMAIKTANEALAQMPTALNAVTAELSTSMESIGKMMQFIEWHGHLTQDFCKSLNTLTSGTVVKDLLTAFSNLTPVAEQMKKSNKSAAAMAMATQNLQLNVARLRESVGRFSDLVLRPDRTVKENDDMKVIVPAESDGDKQFQIQNLIQNFGYDPEDAAEYVESGLGNGLGMM